MFYSIEKHKHLQDIVSPYVNNIDCCGVMVPSFPELEEKDIEYICESIRVYSN